jgi:type IV secretory pathway TrbD component
MDTMFIYPLLGGAVAYFITGIIFRNIRKSGTIRLASNLYNAGIATLIAGGMLRGILEIAGTGSAYAVVFNIAGWGFVGLGVLFWIIAVRHGARDMRAQHED